MADAGTPNPSKSNPIGNLFTELFGGGVKNLIKKIPGGSCLAPVVGCGCLSLIALAIIFLLFLQFDIKARLSAEPPPKTETTGQLASRQSATGGTNSGQIDPATTDSDCSELLETFGDTQLTRHSIINQAARRWGVSAALVAAVAEAESGFNPNRTSPAGAQGLMQIMPETWAGLYNPKDGLPDNPYDARASAFYGAKYLAEVRNQVGDNVTLIAAGYNAGPAAVVRYGGVPPYSETQNYAKRVTRNYQKYLDCLTAETRPDVGGDPKSIARRILANNNINLFPFVSPAPREDITGVAEGTQTLSTNMLAAMDALGQDYRYRVVAITGGGHSATSYHYRGSAFDIDRVDGVDVADKPLAAKALMERCKAMGAVEVYGPWNDPDGNHWHHIHCAWPE